MVFFPSPRSSPELACNRLVIFGAPHHSFRFTFRFSGALRPSLPLY